MQPPHILTAILPCNDVSVSQAFYQRLGFVHAVGDLQYLMVSDGMGATLHLQPAVPGWLTPDRNPFGLYLYAEDVDALAAQFTGELLGGATGPEMKPWHMYEFAVSDPDGTLVRVGRCSANAR